MELRAEREIRIFDLFISLCQRWRSLLICLIIGAVVLGAYGWFKNSGTGDAASPETAEDHARIISAWETVLGADDINAVDRLFVLFRNMTS